MLLLNGFFQSLQFMAYNTIAYADVPRAAHEHGDQLLYDVPADVADAGDCHIGGGAGGVDPRDGHHQQPLLSDFSVAFLVVAGISLAAPVFSLRLDKGAGDELSGHRDRAAKPRVAVAE